MPRPSRIALTLVLAAAGVATLLVGAELAYRWRSRDLRTPVRYYTHARLSRAPVRGADYDGRVHINRLGLRGPDVDAAKAPGTTRILTVGASTTFDPCVRSDAETWPARLEHWLNALAPGRSFQVLNAGVSGASMLDHLLRLHTELWRLEPDAVILYAGHGIVTAADARESERGDPAMPDAAPPRSALDAWLREHSRLYERLRPLAPTDAPAGDMSDDDWARAVDNAARHFTRDLTSYAVVAQSLGAHPVFVEISRLTGERAPATFAPDERAAWERAFGTPPEVVHAGYVAFDSVWQSVADSVGATYVGTDDIGVTGPANFCTADPIHLSTAGSDAMARRLAEQLLATDAL